MDAQRLRALAACVACAALTAGCGGGGSDAGSNLNPTPPAPAPGPAPGPAPAPSTGAPPITPSANGARATVDYINDAVADIATAGSTDGLPGASLTAALPTGATVTGSFPCSSGNVSYSYTYNDATAAPVSYSFSYNNCSYGTAQYGYTYNGTATLNYSNYLSATSFSFSQVYDITYTYTSNGYTSSGSSKFSQTCNYTSTGLQCSYLVGDNAVSDISVSSSGSVTTVSSATVTSGSVTLRYTGWVYDAGTGRATAGTVTVSDGNGNSATVQVVSGGYRVTVVYNGATTVYDVAY